MVRTSPGFVARSLGRFSVIGAIAVIFTSSARRLAIEIAAITIAAPLMSVFIAIMPSGGLSDSPPESKVMPLPTSAMWGSSLSGLGS